MTTFETMSSGTMTPGTMTEDEMRRVAVRRANAKLGFRQHAFIYVMVIGGLAAVNLLTSPGYLWFVWPLGGWGIGLLSHGLSVHGVMAGDREAMIEREMVRLREQRAGRI
jgi:hypothetical protein